MALTLQRRAKQVGLPAWASRHSSGPSCASYTITQTKARQFKHQQWWSHILKASDQRVHRAGLFWGLLLGCW